MIFNALYSSSYWCSSISVWNVCFSLLSSYFCSLDAYRKRPIWKDNFMEELGSTLSELEKQLATTHDLVNIRGKQGRKVPVLIPPFCQRVLGVITDEENRKFVGILPENPYVFSISGKTLSHLRTYDCINTVAQDCGAKCPEDKINQDEKIHSNC